MLILLSPDLGRLKDEQRVQRTQEDVIDALYTYTSSNYKDHLSKYGEILTMCSYITNVSIHFKTFLFNRLKDVETNLTSSSSASANANAAANTTTSSSSDSTAASTSSSPTAAAKNQKSLQQPQQTPHTCGLLMELLKGDLLFQPSYSLMTWHFIQLHYILLYTVYIYSRSFYYYYFYSFICYFYVILWYHIINYLIN